MQNPFSSSEIKIGTKHGTYKINSSKISNRVEYVSQYSVVNARFTRQMTVVAWSLTFETIYIGLS